MGFVFYKSTFYVSAHYCPEKPNLYILLNPLCASQNGVMAVESKDRNKSLNTALI